MIGCDIDGTLLDYNYIPGQMPNVNLELIRELRRFDVDEIVLISNQGGLPFGFQDFERKDGRRYPRPEDFVNRLIFLTGALSLWGIRIVALHACTYHPRAAGDYSWRAASAVDEMLDRAAPQMIKFIHHEATYRKPAPRMIVEAFVDQYYGDSDEDEQAAEDAGIKFLRVERFGGTS